MVDKHGEPGIGGRIGRGAGRFARSILKPKQPVDPGSQGPNPQLRKYADTVSAATEQTTRFVREHEAEIKQAASMGARVAASRSPSRIVRTVASALAHELQPAQPPEPGTGDASAAKGRPEGSRDDRSSESR